MKCRYCGGNLSLEAEVCPYCGKVNEHAQQHVRDMKRYRSAFERTRRDVQDSAHRFSGITVRVAIACVMFVAIIVLFIAGARAYEFRRMWYEGQANKRAAEYMEQMDTYLEQEDFLSFTNFCTEKYIYTYDTEFEKYSQLEQLSRNYMYVYEQMMGVLCPPQYLEKEEILERLTESLEYFYDTLDPERYSYYKGYDSEQNQKAIAAMEYHVQLMLRSFCNLTQEEAAGFQNLSAARRGVLLEEAWDRAAAEDVVQESGEVSDEK